MAVRESDRTFADAAVGPLHGPRLEVEAGEVRLVEAVEVIVYDHHPPMLVAHVAGEVDLGGADPAVWRGRQLRQAAAGIVGGGSEDLILLKDRGAAVDAKVVGRRIVAPEE